MDSVELNMYIFIVLRKRGLFRHKKTLSFYVLSFLGGFYSDLMVKCHVKRKSFSLYIHCEMEKLFRQIIE